MDQVELIIHQEKYTNYKSEFLTQILEIKLRKINKKLLINAYVTACQAQCITGTTTVGFVEAKKKGTN